MRRLKALAIAGGMAVVWASGAEAQQRQPRIPQPEGFFFDGNQLLNFCESPDVNLRSSCLGFVAGVHDTVLLARAAGWRGALASCPPVGITVQQVANIVVDYLRSHPQGRDIGASGLVMAALAESHPCRRR